MPRAGHPRAPGRLHRHEIADISAGGRTGLRRGRSQPRLGGGAGPRLRRDRRRDLLLRNGQRGPLAVQRPFFPEGPRVCHVYAAAPARRAGGRRSPADRRRGRRRRARADHHAGRHQVYRSAGPTARQRAPVRVAGGGALEWLPQETILFDGAIADAATRVDLGAGAPLHRPRPGLLRPAGARRALRARALPPAPRAVARRASAVLERGDFDGGGADARARWGLGGAPVMGTLAGRARARRRARGVAAAARAGARRCPRRPGRGHPSSTARAPSLAVLPLRGRAAPSAARASCARPGRAAAAAAGTRRRSPRASGPPDTERQGAPWS